MSWNSYYAWSWPSMKLDGLEDAPRIPVHAHSLNHEHGIHCLRQRVEMATGKWDTVEGEVDCGIRTWDDPLIAGASSLPRYIASPLHDPDNIVVSHFFCNRGLKVFDPRWLPDQNILALESKWLRGAILLSDVRLCIQARVAEGAMLLNNITYSDVRLCIQAKLAASWGCNMQMHACKRNRYKWHSHHPCKRSSLRLGICKYVDTMKCPCTWFFILRCEWSFLPNNII